MIVADYIAKIDFYTSALGAAQVKIDEGYRWGYPALLSTRIKIKKAFIYLATLSRYNPEGTNVLTAQQADFIFFQLDKLKL